jgi:hypothetical protein
VTIEEFRKYRWGAGMKAKYHSGEYPIVSCDFEEELVGLKNVVSGSDNITWVRCENMDIVTASRQASPAVFRAGV